MGGERNRKNERTGYHFISSAVELRLINALLSVCCDPARAAHEGREREKGRSIMVEEEKRVGACVWHRVTRLYCVDHPFIIFRVFYRAIDGGMQIKQVKSKLCR